MCRPAAVSSLAGGCIKEFVCFVSALTTFSLMSAALYASNTAEMRTGCSAYDPPVTTMLWTTCDCDIPGIPCGWTGEPGTTKASYMLYLVGYVLVIVGFLILVAIVCGPPGLREHEPSSRIPAVAYAAAFVCALASMTILLTTTGDFERGGQVEALWPVNVACAGCLAALITSALAAARHAILASSGDVEYQQIEPVEL